MVAVPVKMTLFNVPIVVVTLPLDATGAKAGLLDDHVITPCELLVGNCVIVSPSRITRCISGCVGYGVVACYGCIVRACGDDGTSRVFVVRTRRARFCVGCACGQCQWVCA